MSTQDLLKWERIYEWAQGQPSGEIVGESCNSTLCPMARYLKAQTGHHWSVGIGLHDLGAHLETPAWMCQLLEQVDALTGDAPGTITREQFLEVLARVRNLSERGEGA